jgi:integrase
VCRSLTQIGGKATREKPKTKRSIRKIKIPAILISELKKWKLQRPANKHNLVLCDPLGRPLNRKSNNRMLKAAAKRAKIRELSMHNLRHTYAAQHLLDGTSVVEVSKLLGHANTDITFKVYSHWSEGEKSDAERRLAESYGLSSVA